MDSVTHIVLGAVTGEVIAGKRLGKRAMLIGAVAQSLPDIDIVAALFLPAWKNLLAHRGITHSFFFGMVATALLAWLASRWKRYPDVSYYRWTLLIGAEILIHLLIDACNAYGVGWLLPFDDTRFSFHTIFVADPLFTLWPFAATVVLLILSVQHRRRTLWAHFGWILPTAYLLIAISNKLQIVRDTKRTLAEQGIAHDRLLTTPAPFNAWLWFIAAAQDTGYHVTYRSVFDERTEPPELTYVARKDSLLAPIRNRKDVEHLLRFSEGYYAMTEEGDNLYFNDLRFGQVLGWSHPNARFVFRYNLTDTTKNLLVMQKGRFEQWDVEALKNYLARIAGKR